MMRHSFGAMTPSMQCTMPRPEDQSESFFRFDAEHAQTGIPLAETPSHELLHSIAGHVTDAEQQDSQLQRHATELEVRLRTKHRNLATREEEFNTRAALVENELRTARLVIRERETELMQRRDEYDSSLRRMQAQNADLVAATTALESEGREQSTSLRARSKDTIQSAELWQRRLKELDRDERLLKAKMADANQLQKRLDEELAKQQNESRRFAEQHEQRKTAAKRQFDERLAQLHEKSERLEHRRMAVEKLHQDVTRMYREAIEVRICTEEIWAQVGDVSSTEMTERLAVLRRRLDDQYHLARQQLGDRKAEIQRLVQELSNHESNLSNRRNEVRGWVARRQEEIEQQARQLVDREQELDSQSANLRHSERQWRSEREQLQQELRRLKRLVREE